MRIPTLISLTIATSTFAAPVHYSIKALIGYDPLLLNPSSEGPQPEASFGAGIGPGASLELSEKIALDAGMNILYDRERFLGTYQESMTSQVEDVHIVTQRWRVGLLLVPTYSITNRIRLGCGYEWDVPIVGSRELHGPTTLNGVGTDLNWSSGSSETSEGIPVASVHNLVANAGGTLSRSFEIFLQAKYGLNRSDRKSVV